ncbi:MAG: hypothetical protein CFE24_11185 [Flavobacterium sp. BFFFF2]|nr:MAG: hypothetical protein CFE24_11185 [Flavobacterium sp. BFFFF2]
MKKDITPTTVNGVYIAAVQEWNDEMLDQSWYMYLINDMDVAIESVMVVTSAFGTLDGELKKTSTLRHAYLEVPAHAAIKVEWLPNNLLDLHNECMVTFFIGNSLRDRKYVFRKGGLTADRLLPLPVLHRPGILAD